MDEGLYMVHNPLWRGFKLLLNFLQSANPMNMASDEDEFVVLTAVTSAV